MTGDAAARAPFRLLLAPGVQPDRWVRVWGERLPDVPLVLVPAPAADLVAALHAGTADAALGPVPAVPAGSRAGDDGIAAVRLYEEVTVVVVPREHVLTAVEELTLADLADEDVLVPSDDVLGLAGAAVAGASPVAATSPDAVALVAGGGGVVLLPLSLARLHARADVDHRPVTDAPTVVVGLLWRPDGPADPELTEELVGIVRGRTARSSRGAAGVPAAAAAPAGERPATPPAPRPRRPSHPQRRADGRGRGTGRRGGR